MSIYLWLDDERKPPFFGVSGIHWTWVKTADGAIELLKSGDVKFASLDHDLADEHYVALLNSAPGAPVDTSHCKEKTGMAVVDWMEENAVWPEEGVRIHTQNTVRGRVMVGVVHKMYGRTFQYVYEGFRDGAGAYLDV